MRLIFTRDKATRRSCWSRTSLKLRNLHLLLERHLAACRPTKRAVKTPVLCGRASNVSCRSLNGNNLVDWCRCLLPIGNHFHLVFFQLFQYFLRFGVSLPCARLNHSAPSISSNGIPPVSPGQLPQFRLQQLHLFLLFFQCKGNVCEIKENDNCKCQWSLIYFTRLFH